MTIKRASNPGDLKTASTLKRREDTVECEPDVAPSDGEIPTYLYQINDVLQDLTNQVDRLGEDINPVLSFKADDEKACGVPRDSCQSPLGDELYSTLLRAKRILDKVADLRSRVVL